MKLREEEPFERKHQVVVKDNAGKIVHVSNEKTREIAVDLAGDLHLGFLLEGTYNMWITIIPLPLENQDGQDSESKPAHT